MSDVTPEASTEKPATPILASASYDTNAESEEEEASQATSVTDPGETREEMIFESWDINQEEMMAIGARTESDAGGYSEETGIEDAFNWDEMMIGDQDDGVATDDETVADTTNGYCKALDEDADDEGSQGGEQTNGEYQPQAKLDMCHATRF